MVAFPPSPAGSSYSSSSASSASASSSFRRTPLFYLSIGSAIVILSLILLSAERHSYHNSSGSGTAWHTNLLAGSSSGTSADQCSNNKHGGEKQKNIHIKKNKVCDPHNLPGTLHLSSENLDSIPNALQTEWKPLSLSSSSSCQPQHYVQRIAPLHSQHQTSSSNTASSSIPSSLYNRTIFLLGDSIDRGNAQYTCHLLQGHYSIIGPEHELWPQNKATEESPIYDRNGNIWHPNEYSPRSFPTICEVNSIDLIVVNVFHFGMDKDGYFEWKDQYGPPYSVEDRIDQIAIPLIRNLGRRIDIIEFSSGLWDLARFGRQDDDALTADSSTTVRHLTSERLEWFSKRFSEVLNHLNEAFPASTSLSSSSTLAFSDDAEAQTQAEENANGNLDKRSPSKTTNLANESQKYIRRLHSASDDDAGSFQKWWQVQGGGKDGEKHTYYFPSWRINELNNAIDAALFSSNNNDIMDADDHEDASRSSNSVSSGNYWKLDRWGDKLAGMELFDKGNVHPHFAATTLWLEQMFYRLVNGQ